VSIFGKLIDNPKVFKEVKQAEMVVVEEVKSGILKTRPKSD